MLAIARQRAADLGRDVDLTEGDAEHFTRRQLPLVQADGFQVVEAERLKAGTVEPPPGSGPPDPRLPVFGD